SGFMEIPGKTSIRSATLARMYHTMRPTASYPVWLTAHITERATAVPPFGAGDLALDFPSAQRCCASQNVKALSLPSQHASVRCRWQTEPNKMVGSATDLSPHRLDPLIKARVAVR